VTHCSKGEARAPPGSTAQVSFHVGKESLARQVTNVSYELTKWRTNKIGNNINDSNASDSFQSTEFLVQSSGKCPYLRLLFSWRPPGFTTTVSIDSNLLGIDLHLQQEVLPAESDCTQSSFRGLVVDLAVVEQPATRFALGNNSVSVREKRVMSLISDFELGVRRAPTLSLRGQAQREEVTLIDVLTSTANDLGCGQETSEWGVDNRTIHNEVCLNNRHHALGLRV